MPRHLPAILSLILLAASTVRSGERAGVVTIDNVEWWDLSGEWLATMVEEEVLIRNLDSGEKSSFELPWTDSLGLFENWLVHDLVEEWEEEDFNRDGDLDDVVYHRFDAMTGETTNLEVGAFPSGHLLDRTFFHLSGKWFISRQLESLSGRDLNGDGDTSDDLLAVRDLDTHRDDFLDAWLDTYSHPFECSGSWLAFRVSECDREGDLNGDGDTEDFILHVRDLERRETTSLDLALVQDPHEEGCSHSDTMGCLPIGRGVACEAFTISFFDYGLFRIAGERLAFQVSERHQGEDLNGDGDRDDFVLHLHDLEHRETINLGIEGHLLDLAPERLVFWNDDGIHVLDLESGQISLHGRTVYLGLSGDQLILTHLESASSGTLFMHDLETGEGINLGLAMTPYRVQRSSCWSLSCLKEWPPSKVTGDWLIYQPSREAAPNVVNLRTIWSLPRFRRGDCNGDSAVDMSDALCILNWLFLAGHEPGCVASTNSNGDGAADMSDAVSLLGHLFLGGPAPVTPFPDCGPGLLDADMSLGCRNPPASCQ